MNEKLVDSIAKAVLYEGYLLYPYRPSAIKNRQRFNFGVLYPRSYSDAHDGTDAWMMQTSCLVVAGDAGRCVVRVRFLRMVDRSVSKFDVPLSDEEKLDATKAKKVDRLELADRLYRPWQEAIEERIELTELNLNALASQSMQWPFRLAAKDEFEAICDEAGQVHGFLLREQKSLSGMIEVSAEPLGEEMFRLEVRIQNTTHLSDPVQEPREQALAHSLVSAHAILEAIAGEFVSLVDPPEQFRELAKSCHNVGVWPVLVGEEGQRSTMLASPIILYDYPQIAPESPGDLFDGAEIDEILSLRIMAMTDEEKREMRQSDERARQILERTENLPEEQLMKLHGAIRGMRPSRGEMP